MSVRPDPTEAQHFLDEHPDVSAIELLIPDLNGVLRGKRIERDALMSVYTDGICLPGSVFGADITGETVEATGLGFEIGDSDQLCWPVPATLCMVPWNDRPMAQLLMSMYELDGTPFYADPQQILAGVLERFKALKLRPQIAVELEFYFIDQRRTAEGAPQPPLSPVTGEREHTTQVYGMNELDDYRQLFEDISDACSIQNVPAEAAVAEYAPGQYEVNLHYKPDAMLACHHAILLKRIIKAIALRHGMEATFMAKPYSDNSGSGTHIHISMLDEPGNNVFTGETEIGSPTLHHAIGGLFATMEESMAIFAPNANSYRRFQHNSFVPLSRSWGWNNRTVAIRIPTGSPEAARLEHRVAGADANPYLLVAALLAGIHHGITNRLDPGAPVTGNAYEGCPSSLPCEWSVALDIFSNRKVLRDYLDERACNVYLASKTSELNQFECHVSPLELQWYLRLV